MKRLISIIIPMYNEEESLPYLYERLAKLANRIEKYNMEFLFVNDGSKDNSLNIVKEYKKSDDRVCYLNLSRNFGKEIAMAAALDYVRGDVVAIIDADLQDPPKLLPQMLEILESGEYDSVATRRVDRVGEPPIRSFFARMFYKIINKISDADIVDGARDFRIMKREMVDAIVELGEYNRFSKGIFGWIGFRTYWLPFENVERVAGETKWSFWKLLKYSIDGIISFSQVPLAMSAFLGMLLTIISFIVIVFVVVRKLIYGDPVSGWASLTCIITFIGGIELFCTGISSQYLAKTYLEVKKRPHFIVSRTNAKDSYKIK